VTDARLLDRVLRVLSGPLMRRARDRLGGSHTVVTYPPLDALDPLLDGEEKLAIQPPVGPLHYYFHIAFCEHICDFCHYTKTRHTPERPSPEADDYIEALESETARRRKALAGSNVASIFVGGGTPTALSEQHLGRVMEMAASVAGRAQPRICVETSPITLAAADGRDKLQLLVESGTDRLSIGVQTFDKDLLPPLRRHDLPTLLVALDMLKATGISFNVDLIQDLAGQTRDSIENDLRFVDRYRPDQVTWYLLRLHSPSVMARRSAGGAPFFVGDTESACRRAMIIEGMMSLGYRREPGGRFTLTGEQDTYKAVRGGLDSHLLGLGASAYSHGWGWFFRNVTHSNARIAIRDYVARIRTGQTPIAWATAITPEERFAGQLCQLSRQHIPGDMVGGDDPAAVAARETIDALVDSGLMAGDESGWAPTETGWLFEEEIASLFYSKRIRARLQALDAYWIAERPRGAGDARASA